MFDCLSTIKHILRLLIDINNRLVRQDATTKPLTVPNINRQLIFGSNYTINEFVNSIIVFNN